MTSQTIAQLAAASGPVPRTFLSVSQLDKTSFKIGGSPRCEASVCLADWTRSAWGTLPRIEASLLTSISSTRSMSPGDPDRGFGG